MHIPFPIICADLCQKVDYFQSFGKGCRIIRRAEVLEYDIQIFTTQYIGCLLCGHYIIAKNLKMMIIAKANCFAVSQIDV